ncbi:MAG: efflux RND transporter periplasmic adaptor subunit, partial [Bdellovibrionales bacterium]
LGIALLVYHYFFKALGVFLMIVELWWFIAKPVLNEMHYWMKHRSEMTLSRKKYISLVISMICLGLILCVPWQTRIKAPAIFKSSQEIPLLSSTAGKLTTINIQSGQIVKQGDILYTIQSPDLNFDIQKATQDKQTLTQDLKNKAVASDTYREASMIRNQLNQKNATLNLKTTEQKSLTIYAPIDGIISDIPDHLTPGQWISKKEFLGLLHSQKTHVEAFIKETDLQRIHPSSLANFYSDKNTKTLNGYIKNIDSNTSHYIPYSELGSNFGGSITMQAAPSKDGRFSPVSRHYKVTMALENPSTPSQTKPGNIYIQSDRQNIVTSLWRRAKSIIIQESGF